MQGEASTHILLSVGRYCCTEGEMYTIPGLYLVVLRAMCMEH